MLIEIIGLHQQIVNSQSKAIVDILENKNNPIAMIKLAEKELDFTKEMFMRIDILVRKCKEEFGDFEIIH